MLSSSDAHFILTLQLNIYIYYLEGQHKVITNNNHVKNISLKFRFKTNRSPLPKC